MMCQVTGQEAKELYPRLELGRVCHSLFDIAEFQTGWVYKLTAVCAIDSHPELWYILVF